jgi:HAD superfamily hydrolase (TIGR01509 family)
MASQTRRRYLLWDHDGVLVDTERWYFEATREALGRLGVDLDQDTYLDHMTRGRSCWDLARSRGISEERIAEHRARRDSVYQEFLLTKPIEIEGVRGVLAQLRSAHRMAIVTSARRADFDLIHESSGLLEFFDFALTIEDYARSKPQPDAYLAALDRFGARQEEALALEDSARGLEAARRAGLDCLVIRSPFTASQDFGAAWRVVDSVREVPALLAT